MTPLPNPTPGFNPRIAPHTQITSPSLLEVALGYLRAGYSIIPIHPDGASNQAKKALVKWAPFQLAPPSEEQVRSWWGGKKQAPGIAIVCGPASGGAELIDFDLNANEVFPTWAELVRREAPELLDRVAIVKSPDGWHVWFRCVEIETPANQKLAIDPSMKEERQTLVETRGKGGYGLVPGTPAKCHPTGRTYDPQGRTHIEQLQPIRARERQLLVETARAFDLSASSPAKQVLPGEGVLPGSDYDLNGPDWVEILSPFGWQIVGGFGPVRLWRRPGKESGTHSATTGVCKGADGCELFKVFSSNAAPFQGGQCYGKFRTYATLRHAGDLSKAARALAGEGYGSTSRSSTRAATSSPAKQLANGPAPEGRIATAQHDTQQHPPMAKRLLDAFFEAGGSAERTDDGTQFLRYKVANSYRVCLLNSSEAKSFLARLAQSLDGSVIDPSMIDRVAFNLRAMADGKAEAESLFLRIGERNCRTYLDLCDEERRAVECSVDGWRVISNPPVYFKRSRGMKAIDPPTRGGHLRELLDWVNVEDKRDQLLLLTWLLSTLRPVGPYPLLIISGQQGSAKSTLAKQLRSLVDPNASPLRGLPEKERDIFLSAQHNHVLAYDNLDMIPPSLSNALCRLSTGGGSSTRELYSNNEETVHDATRPAILTGIGNVATKADLLSRGFMIELTPIKKSQRQLEGELWARWREELPRLTGALLDAYCAALRRADYRPSQFVSRMPDVERLACAAGPHLGWTDEEVVEAMERNEQTASETALSADVLVEPLRKLVESNAGSWRGRAEELLAELAKITPKSLTEHRSWPRTANALSTRVAGLAPALREFGMEVERGIEANRARTRFIRLICPGSTPFD